MINKNIDFKWPTAIQSAARERNEKWESLSKTLSHPSYPVQQMGRVFYSGGLSRRHRGNGRLDIAAILIEGEALTKASNSVSVPGHSEMAIG